MQFCWGVYLGNRYREPILKFERLILGSAFPHSKHQIIRKDNPSSDDAVLPANLRPLRTEASASPATTDSIPNASAIPKRETFSERSDNDGSMLDNAAFSTTELAPPPSPHQVYQNRKADTVVDASRNRLSSSSKVAQPLAGPRPSTAPVSAPKSQPFDKEVATAANPAVSNPMDENAWTNANSSSGNTTQATHGSVPMVRSVKVVVDKAYVDTHSNWISEVMRTIGELSRVFRLEFGIGFDLIGVVCWSDAFPYMSDSELLFNLYNHATEGADIVLGFVNRPVTVEALSQGELKTPGQSHRTFGLVGTDEHFVPVFLPSALRSLGVIFGAKRVIDPSSEAYELGSWMSHATVRSDRPLWIDLPNKRRIFESKARLAMASNISAP